MKKPDIDVYSYTKGLYKFLDGGHNIVLKSMNHYHGWIHPLPEVNESKENFTTTMQLNYKTALISTLVHEYLHFRHPKMSETDILKLERYLMNRFTERQIRNIIKRFAAVL